jgi:hypothetical protein
MRIRCTRPVRRVRRPVSARAAIVPHDRIGAETPAPTPDATWQPRWWRSFWEA